MEVRHLGGPCDARAQESFIGTPDGVVWAWTFKRVGEQDRWRHEDVLALKGTTQQQDPRRQGEDANIRIAAERVPEDLPAPPAEAPPVVRSSYIRRSDVSVHGYTPGCKGCTAPRMRKPPQGHSDVCRGRSIELLKARPDTKERVERAEETRDTKLARHIELQDHTRGDDPHASSAQSAASGGAAQGAGMAVQAGRAIPPARLARRHHARTHRQEAPRTSQGMTRGCRMPAESRRRRVHKEG